MTSPAHQIARLLLMAAREQLQEDENEEPPLADGASDEQGKEESNDS